MKTLAIILMAGTAIGTVVFGVDRYLTEGLSGEQVTALAVQFALCLGGIGLVRKAHLWTKDLYAYEDDEDEKEI